MIAQFGILIFLCVLSFVIYKLIPAIEHALKKEKKITHNNYTTLGFPTSTQENKLNTYDDSPPQIQEQIPEDPEEKIDRIFSNPDFASKVETNFDSLGIEKR